MSDDAAAAARTFGEHFLGHDFCPRLLRTEERATQRIEQAPFCRISDLYRHGLQRQSMDEFDQRSRRAIGRQGSQFHFLFLNCCWFFIQFFFITAAPNPLPARLYSSRGGLNMSSIKALDAPVRTVC